MVRRPGRSVGWSCCCLRATLDEGVQQDRAQQQQADEGLEPVGVPPGVDDALVDHAEDQRADRGADHGPAPAGRGEKQTEA